MRWNSLLGVGSGGVCVCLAPAYSVNSLRTGPLGPMLFQDLQHRAECVVGK